MATPCEQVFETVELLEIILYKLPTRDLLFSQRVARQWKAVIENSRSLQQALFMIPVHDAGRPLVLATGEDGEISCDIVEEQNIENLNLLKNPLINRFLECAADITRGESFLKQLPACWRYSGAKWRTMLLTQPSIKGLVTYVEEETECFVDMGGRDMNTGTMRMGELAEWIEQEYKGGDNTCGKCVELQLVSMHNGPPQTLEVRDLSPLENSAQLEEWKLKLAKVDR